MSSSMTLEEAIVRPKRPPAEKSRSKHKPKRQPPYAVILHNDDLNTFDFVIATIKKVFGYSTFKALRMTVAVHTTGRCAVWTGTLEHAELKAEQLRSAGVDPERASVGAPPLGVSIEPLPSD